jgi:hypothetical protein
MKINAINIIAFCAIVTIKSSRNSLNKYPAMKNEKLSGNKSNRQHDGSFMS